MYLKITKQHKLFVLFCVQYIFVFRGINISCVFVFPFSGQFSRIYIVLHLFMIIQTSILKRLKPFINMNTFFFVFQNCETYIYFTLFVQLCFHFFYSLYFAFHIFEKFTCYVIHGRKNWLVKDLYTIGYHSCVCGICKYYIQYKTYSMALKQAEKRWIGQDLGIIMNT